MKREGEREPVSASKHKYNGVSGNWVEQNNLCFLGGDIFML